MSIINYENKEINFKIIYYGSAKVGKTTNVRYIAQTNNVVSMPSGEYVTVRMGEINGFDLLVHLYAVSAEDAFAKQRKSALIGADGIVFVVDSQMDKLDNTLSALRELNSNLKDFGYSDKNTPMVYQLNKRDLPNSMSTKEMTEKFKAKNISMFEAVAETGSGVFDTFKAVTSKVLKNL